MTFFTDCSGTLSNNLVTAPSTGHQVLLVKTVKKEMITDDMKNKPSRLKNKEVKQENTADLVSYP